MKASKWQLPFGGRPVIQWVAQQVAAAEFDQHYVVLGHQAEEIAPLLADSDCQIIVNPHYQAGMHSSIKRAVEVMGEQVGFFAICLADMPLLQTKDYQRLVVAAQKNAQAEVIVPTFASQRGHPVLISYRLRQAILCHPDDDKGCSYLFKSHVPLEVEMDNDHCLRDMDTLEDYQALLIRIENG